MAKVIDPKILVSAENFKTNDVFPIIFMERFLDDIKMVWRGSAEKLHAFLDDINKIHPSTPHPNFKVMCVDVQQQHQYYFWTHPAVLSMVLSRLICIRRKLITISISSPPPAIPPMSHTISHSPSPSF